MIFARNRLRDTAMSVRVEVGTVSPMNSRLAKVSRSRIVRSAADVRVAAVLYTRQSDLAPLDEPAVQIARTREHLDTLKREVTAPSLIAIGTEIPQAIETTLELLRFWPTTPCVWFAQRAMPMVPTGSPMLRAVSTLSLSAPADLLRHVRAHERERRRQLEAAAELTRCFRVEGVSAAITALVALRVPWSRIHELTHQKQFAKYCSESLYPRFGVNSSQELITIVMDFECKFRRGDVVR